MFHRSYGQLRHNWIFQTACCLYVLYIHRSLDPWNFVNRNLVRKSFPSYRSFIVHLLRPHSNLARVPTYRSSILRNRSSISKAITTFLDLTQRTRFVAILVNNSRWRLVFGRVTHRVLLLWRSLWLTTRWRWRYDGAIFWQGIFSLLGRGRKMRPDMNRDALARIYS